MFGFGKEKQMNEIRLGDLAKDKISGFTGIVIANTEWLNGCVRLLLAPRELKDGKPIEGQSFDVEQLELISREVIITARSGAQQVRETPRERTGGPQPEPTRNATPTR